MGVIDGGTGGDRSNTNTSEDRLISFGVNSSTTTPRFLASLSDGRTVIQDDRQDERHAWARLQEWLKLNPDISITNLRLQKSGLPDISLPSNQSGYFFGYKQAGVWGGPQHNYVGIGYYDGNEVHITWYRQPNFDHSFNETRDAKKAGHLLTRRRSGR